MKKLIRILLPIAMIIAACALYAQPIHVLTTGDMHGWIEEQQIGDQTLGGAAQMLAYWKTVEGYKPENFLVLSAGDIATGPAISTAFKGDPVVNVMNLMGYDATCIGNHEFDFGVDHIKVWEKTAKFPFLSANITTSKGEITDFEAPYVILSDGGVRVAIVGLTTTDLHTLTNNAAAYDIHPYAEALRNFVPAARKAGAQAVIVLAHVPQSELESLAGSVADLGIPLMIGGHSHEFDRKQVGKTWVVNSGESWEGYTRVDLDFNPKTGKTIVLSSKQVRLQQDNPSTDPAVAAETKLWKDKMGADYGDVIGYTVTGLDKNALYKLVPRATLEFDPTADVGMTNHGSMRQSIPPGPITKDVVLGVMPFSNALIRIKVTGKALVKSLGVVAAAGLRKDGDRLVLSKTGQPIGPKAIYTVVLNDYLYWVTSSLKSADPKPEKIAESWRDPVYQWFAKHPTSKEKPVEGF